MRIPCERAFIVILCDRMIKTPSRPTFDCCASLIFWADKRSINATLCSIEMVDPGSLCLP